MTTPQRKFPDLDQLYTLATRALVWGLLLGILWAIRPFFLLVFLTFLFAYTQQNLVHRLKPVLPNRTLRVTLVGLSLLGVMILVGAYIVPSVNQQARLFVEKLPVYLDSVDRGLEHLDSRYPMLPTLIPELQISQDSATSPARTLLQLIFGNGATSNTRSHVQFGLETIRDISSVGSSFLLSLLFSFLIVLDLHKLGDSTRKLKDTRLGFIYEEMSTSVTDFARVMGRALEAQLLIAFVNTVLTAIGLHLLGLGDRVAFLSTIVFLCSFIPVAGVFISSVPICLVALQEAGLTLMMFAIALITGIHMIEAYILNPKIYGRHMRLNPVLVLIILTVAGKLFHFWGFILGVPVCTYIFGHAIQYKSSKI